MDVTSKAGRQPVRHDFDDAAEGVAIRASAVDLGNHRRTGVRIEAAHRVGIDAVTIARCGHKSRRGAHLPDRDNVAQHLDVQRLSQEAGGDLTERHPGGGLAGACPFENRPDVVERVFLHPDEVGVARTRSGQRGIAGEVGQLVFVDGIGGHHLLPLRPLAVADPDRNRAAHRNAVPDAAEEVDLVTLERHASAATVTGAAPGKRVGNLMRSRCARQRAAPRESRRVRDHATRQRSATAACSESPMNARRVSLRLAPELHRPRPVDPGGADVA